MRVRGAGTPQSKLPLIREGRRRSEQKKKLKSQGKAGAASRVAPRCFEGYRRLSGNRFPPWRLAKASASSVF
jgi:hypothetical protein